MESHFLLHHVLLFHKIMHDKMRYLVEPVVYAVSSLLSVSEADDITCLMILDSVMIALLLNLSLFCFTKKNVEQL